MNTSAYPAPDLWRESPPPHRSSSWSSERADAALEFGRFRVLLRRRQLLADGIPVELSTRAFDLLLVLLEADGSLVTKNELLRRVWPGIGVAEENLKVQMCALRKGLGEDRDFIRTEFGRGYRFTATVRWRCHSDIRRAGRWEGPSPRNSSLARELTTDNRQGGGRPRNLRRGGLR
jgi:DNA-binding winged helix-turn-helix (wHTH) protein